MRTPAAAPLLVVPLVVAAALALPCCRTRPAVSDPATGAVSGTIEGAQSFPGDARVQVYRIDESGIPVPDPFESVRVDRLGKFTTRVLTPGRYRLVYRSLEAPPSTAAAKVPPDFRVTLRPLVAAGLAQLRVTAARPDAEPARCRLTEAEPGGDLPDVREFRCAPGAPVLLRGLRPGRWYLDLPDVGATTEIVLPRRDPLRELELDPPAIAATASLTGQVLRISGTGAPWAVVSARPLTASGEAGAAWGRYAVTDRAGMFRIVGIPPGPALVRVECREVRYVLLPAAQVVAIPPSERASIGFVVEP
jgi:hypothetical protein